MYVCAYINLVLEILTVFTSSKTDAVSPRAATKYKRVAGDIDKDSIRDVVLRMPRWQLNDKTVTMDTVMHTCCCVLMEPPFLNVEYFYV